jgi:hypothetical protein
VVEASREREQRLAERAQQGATLDELRRQLRGVPVHLGGACEMTSESHRGIARNHRNAKRSSATAAVASKGRAIPPSQMAAPTRIVAAVMAATPRVALLFREWSLSGALRRERNGPRPPARLPAAYSREEPIHPTERRPDSSTDSSNKAELLLTRDDHRERKHSNDRCEKEKPPGQDERRGGSDEVREE